MNITVTGRHLSVSENLREYAEKKIKKLERHFNQLIDAHIILAVEKLDHKCEVVINGDGVQFHGREKAADLYSAIDLLFEKMETQIRRYKERHQMHKGPEKGEAASINFTSNEGKQVILRQVSNKPVDNIEAFLQMRIDKRDYILFKKGVGKMEADLSSDNNNYAVIYRDLNGLKLVELPRDRGEGGLQDERFVAYSLDIFDDSAANPKVEFKKLSSCDMMPMTLHEAIVEIEKSKKKFMPFFNVESEYINIISKNGNKYEVMVPAF
ncbi:MAG: ribosome-associated translation inhibitor RaiA [Spirochaetes bacterium]|nr:ribosome-associated translation inhibitor RaiA [Spirochaetota bacterium]